MYFTFLVPILSVFGESSNLIDRTAPNFSVFPYFHGSVQPKTNFMYAYKDAVSKLASSLLKFKSIGIISHVRPDGDAIGSQVAMAIWLRSEGIETVCHNEDPIPANISWIAGYGPVGKLPENELDLCDAFLFVDGNSHERFGEHSDYFQKCGKPVFMIDHHPQPAGYYDASVSITEAGSTAELVFLLLDETRPDVIGREIAEALYAGIMTDTGSFRFDSTGAHTHRIVSELIERGGLNVAEIHEKVYDDRSINQYKLISRALDQIFIEGRTQFAGMFVTEDDLEETGCTHDDIEGLINYPLALKGIQTAVLFSERKNKVKLSFRSKSGLDVNVLARNFNGGGHKKAAGGWHPGPIEQAVEDVTQKIYELSGVSRA